MLYLWAYTVALACLLAPWRGRAARVALPVPLALALPPLGLLAARALLLARFPPNDALLGDWYDHALYGGAFLFGYAVAEHEPFWRVTERLRWPALAGATVLLPSVWAAGGVALPGAVARLPCRPPWPCRPTSGRRSWPSWAWVDAGCRARTARRGGC